MPRRTTRAPAPPVLPDDDPRSAALLAAIAAADLEGVRRCLAEGADPNACDGEKAAVELVPHRQWDILWALVDAGARHESLRGQIYWAAVYAEPRTILALIAQGADIRRDGDALMTAVRRGRRDAVEAMLGTRPDLGRDGGTLLSGALAGGHLDIACRLIEAGADPRGDGHRPDRPLAVASAGGHGELLRVVLERGVEPDLPCERTSTSLPGPAWIEGSTPLILAVRHGHVAIARRLLEAGADPARADADGMTALAWAAKLGDEAALSTLRALGACVSVPTPDEALLVAAAAGALDGVEAAVRAGAMVDARDRRAATRDWTPLMHAAAAGHAVVVSRLLQLGADVEADDAGETTAAAARSAYELGGVDALDWMGLSLGRVALHRASAAGHRAVVQALLAGGAKPNREDLLRHTPLFVACEAGHEGAALALLDAGASLASRGPGRASALHAAVRSGSAAVVRALIGAGAAPEAKDARGRTPRDLASPELAPAFGDPPPRKRRVRQPTER